MRIASSVLMLVALVLLSCNPFAPDQKVVLGVSKLEAPASISAGSPLNIVVTVTTGGCTSFDRFEVNRDASSATLTAWGNDASKGEKGVACPANIVDTPHSYQFDPPFTNPFTIQVQRGRLSPLTATVQVQ